MKYIYLHVIVKHKLQRVNQTMSYYGKRVMLSFIPKGKGDEAGIQITFYTNLPYPFYENVSRTPVLNYKSQLYQRLNLIIQK